MSGRDDRIGVPMNRRRITIIVGLLDAIVWALAAFATFMSGSDPATRGLDQAAGSMVTALFLVTGAPALALAYLGRAPVVALVLALAFPIAIAAILIVAVMAFA